MSRDAIQFAGEFGIEELKIASPSGGVADLLTDVLVIEINIFEDIFKNTNSPRPISESISCKSSSVALM